MPEDASNNPAQPDTALGWFFRHETEWAERIYLRQPVQRQWVDFSWARVGDEARRMAAALLAHGVTAGDRVAILSKNCAEWVIADLAIMMAGAVSVPIYATANASNIRHILEHSGARVIFVGKLDDWQEQQQGIGDALLRIDMRYPTMPCKLGWEECLAAHAPLQTPHSPGADELMTILYTSGSTGQPKGAMHNHANFLYAGIQLGRHLDFRAEEHIVSYLPLAHCTERAYVEAATLVHGGVLHFTESLETFMDDLREARPHFFGSVPRLWKRFQLGVLQKIPAQKLERMLRLPVVNRLVRKKILRQLGLDRSRWFMSGSAPISRTLLDWWQQVGVTIAEGWGMTETLAYGVMGSYGEPLRTGSVGRAATGAEVRVSEQGEIQIRVPTLMQGYYQAPELTAETITDDGFLRTGDRGRIDEEGYVFITGRLKDLFKTAKGKYVNPVAIESQLGRDALVELSCLVGSGLTQPVALLVLAEAAAALPREQVETRLDSLRQTINAGLESHERIDHMIVVAEEWTPENGALTPTLKIKRHVLEERYSPLLARLGQAPVQFESPA